MCKKSCNYLRYSFLDIRENAKWYRFFASSRQSDELKHIQHLQWESSTQATSYTLVFCLFRLSDFLLLDVAPSLLLVLAYGTIYLRTLPPHRRCLHLEPNSTTRTPATNTSYEHHLRTNTTNRQKIATSQHLDMSRCWALALRCGKVVVELL